MIFNFACTFLITVVSLLVRTVKIYFADRSFLFYRCVKGSYLLQLPPTVLSFNDTKFIRYDLNVLKILNIFYAYYINLKNESDLLLSIF